MRHYKPSSFDQDPFPQRTRAFKIRPYPCIGQPTFPDLVASRHPAYAEILAKLKSGSSFLDAGCCLGQDLRKLLFDGAPSSDSLYGLDMEPAFFDLGYELFRDRDSMRATFITADLTKPSIPSTEPFVSGVDIISAHSLFHLFNLEEQKIVAKHLVRLTKPNAGSMIFGLHIGTLEAVERHAIFDDAVVFFHNVESFDRFWQDVGTATDSRWRVDARAEQIPEMGRSQAWCMPDTTLFVFTVRRM